MGPSGCLPLHALHLYINPLDVDEPAQVHSSWPSAGVGTQKHPRIHWNVSLSNEPDQIGTYENILKNHEHVNNKADIEII